MPWVHLVTLLALVEFLVFGVLVGRARARYGIRAPAISGHDVFERYFRVQMNTLELLIVFVPALWMAAQYWNPAWCAAVGAVFLVGRVIYFRAYVAEPRSRSLGFILSIAPAGLLLIGTAVGALKALAGF